MRERRERDRRRAAASAPRRSRGETPAAEATRSSGRTGGAGVAADGGRRGGRDPAARRPPAAPERRIAWRSTTSPPRSTTPTATRISATHSRRSAPTSLRGITACSASEVWFLIGMDEHGQKVAQTAADRGLTPQALVDEVAETLPGDVAPPRHLERSVHAHHRARAQARRAGADRAHLRAEPERLLREVVRGLLLRRLRVVQAGQRDRRRQAACCIRRACSSGWRNATGSSG